MVQVETRSEAGPHVVDSLMVVCGGRLRSTRRWTRLCLACRRRRSLFSYRGVVKADRHHNLCFECYRAEVNRFRMYRPGPAGMRVTPANPRPAPSRLATDRPALLLELRLRRRRALMMARHALDTPAAARVDEAMAS